MIECSVRDLVGFHLVMIASGYVCACREGPVMWDVSKPCPAGHIFFKQEGWKNEVRVRSSGFFRNHIPVLCFFSSHAWNCLVRTGHLDLPGQIRSFFQGVTPKPVAKSRSVVYPWKNREFTFSGLAYIWCCQRDASQSWQHWLPEFHRHTFGPHRSTSLADGIVIWHRDVCVMEVDDGWRGSFMMMIDFQCEMFIYG